MQTGRILLPPPLHSRRLEQDSSYDSSYSSSESGPGDSPVYAPNSEPVTPADSYGAEEPYIAHNEAGGKGITAQIPLGAKHNLIQRASRMSLKTISDEQRIVHTAPIDFDSENEVELLFDADTGVVADVHHSNSTASLTTETPSDSPVLENIQSSSQQSLYSIPNIPLGGSPQLAPPLTASVSATSAATTIGSFTSVHDLDITASGSAASFTTVREALSPSVSQVSAVDAPQNVKQEDSVVFLLPLQTIEILVPPSAQVEIGEELAPYTLMDIIRVILFLPWLLTVGAALFLYPAVLESLVFETPATVNIAILSSFPRAVLPSGPVRRLALYSQIAPGAAASFCTLLLALGLYGGTAGRTTVAIAAGRAVMVWARFELSGKLEEEQDMRCVWAALKGEEEKLIVWMVGASFKAASGNDGTARPLLL